ncbi:hypothetical protein AJ88_43655 [Mesorhizobium amorphae CCBAU 01583]|nr:hypothetical protein AJ88_43655 [Mesorhizobium amorphae CCBAU 01583]
MGASLTAYFSLLKTGNPKQGETVLISAATGGVGQIAGQIARIKGLDPVAVVGTDAKLEWCKKLGYREGVNHRTSTDLVADVAAACPNGVDLFIDNTAGPIHDAAMLNLIRSVELSSSERSLWPIDLINQISVCGISGKL